MPPRKPTALTRPPTKGDEAKARYIRELSKKSTPQEQLTFFQAFAAGTPSGYTQLVEFFDSIPKFFLTPQSSARNAEPLEIHRFQFRWGEHDWTATIAPVVVESRGSDGKTMRKDIMPGPREETIYRALKKMAADPSAQRVIRETNVVLRFTLSQLRAELREVGHEYKIWELKEGLEVLNRSPLTITNTTQNKKLYSGSYIALQYFSDESDDSGTRSRVEVAFNELALAAIRAKLYYRIHYGRLLSLSPVGAWIYERLTRNFRQAGADHGYKLSLSAILRSGLRPRPDIRQNVRQLRTVLNELVEKEVLAMYPGAKEEVTYEPKTGKPGRPPIQEVVWTVWPHENVVRDIRTDNAAKLQQSESLELS